jgi:hypothetical protein
MIRLVVSVFLSFFFGVLLASLEAFVFHGKGGFSPQIIFGAILILISELVLFLTCPREKKLYLFLAILAFSSLGCLMASQDVFVHGTGGCTTATYIVCSIGLGLVVTYPGKKEA